MNPWYHCRDVSGDPWLGPHDTETRQALGGLHTSDGILTKLNFVRKILLYRSSNIGFARLPGYGFIYFVSAGSRLNNFLKYIGKTILKMILKYKIYMYKSYGFYYFVSEASCESRLNNFLKYIGKTILKMILKYLFISVGLKTKR